ncbi:EAL domain-containing protein [Aestuariirhabdus sp. Z084]|uniref:EAL domain-containing response regulator n=1 Tax=Aestuariirhabdus haliotis TaxID=2918751 RepID=UPI00201B3BDA|nr:EAL domain-containing protein [Aestuariirhabdus haliotis]MCL6415619.1 EAL domain-containing protein [Aestuariirhabdus haliotis]MCL6419614.1 EAL domain-containing protein [Aestuariirhabdus haliotis]
MPKDKKTLRLLIIEESQNDAEQLVNVFRNSGHATRAHRTISAEALEEELQNQTWDLLLASEDSDEISADQALDIVNSMHKDIPVLLLLPEPSQQQITEALLKGFRDVIPYDEDKRLVLVANKELAQLEERRKRRQLEVSLKETEKRCQLLLDSSVDAIAYIHDGMHIYANRAYVELFGYEDADDLAGMPIIDMVASEDQANIKKMLKEHQREKGAERKLVCSGQRQDESQFKANMEFSPASYDGEPCEQVVIRVDTGNPELEEKLKEISTQDLVTGLFNRDYFSQQLDAAIERAVATNKNSSVFYFSLDNFAEIREKAGISGTDLVLTDIGSLLKENVPSPNILARYGDDIFLGLVGSDQIDKLKAVGEKICKEVAEHMSDVSGVTVQTTCSIGIAIVNETTSSASGIMDRAQKAASRAQAAGGSRCHLHNPKDDIEAQANKGDIGAMIQQALDNNSFKLLFQPIISLRGDSHEHYEVLLRLIDGENNEISPKEFMGIASEAGLSTKIDRWAILQSIKLLAGHRANGHDTRLFIHLSGDSIMDPTLPPWLSVALKAARLPSDAIIFEISEKDASTHLKQAKELTAAINELHCRVALGHFGGSLNPFNNLKHLDVAFVKLDGSFSEDIDNDDTLENLKTMISSLQGEGKLTIVPMVESAPMLSTLWQAGVNYIQGYYLQGPAENMDYDFSSDM